ncbi:bifunctional (p)ppGpp synthetase/guanosine-3',5'-bis(diphosphate) 3'-pyrophosphohydrolase [bacterium]|nr:bifunctional (p)ppGpp synthetase/guanosine-3',5'-bis(diphosphate) 3'-pyrophosphohydrolase [bacterium]
MSNYKKVNIDRKLDKILRKIKEYLPDFDKKKFLEAFRFAEKAHQGQLRKDNKTPYIMHPLEVVLTLTKLHADESSLISGLIHDVPEDTDRTIQDVKNLFGEEIAFLVDGITKLSKVYYRHDMAERQIESLKKLLLHSAKDPRVILIKLADRLHNMSTLQFVKPEKRFRIAKETLEIYVPIANLLGMDEIKKQLEDYCFQYLFQKDYEKIQRVLTNMKIKQTNVLGKTIDIIKKELNNENLKNPDIYGREKSPYSVFKKTIRKNEKPEELEDLLALRIIVNNIKECYLVLGIIHSIFKPKPGRFKDYIAVPKPNGYQSLHTVVFGYKGQTTEFQIRTRNMHLDAQYGIAAHYFYKTKGNNDANYKKRHSKWAQKILEYQKSSQDSADFLEALKLDIFQDRIFIFTPRGDTIDLPRGASAIDLAYNIHTDIGNSALKAEINGKIVPLTYTLETGDVVNIITANQPMGPNREWLIFAKTNLAKNKIRETLRKSSRIKKLSVGRKLLQKVFDRAGVGLIEEIPKRKVKELTHLCNTKCKTMNDILISVGEGSINPLDILRTIYPSKRFISNKRGFFEKLFKKTKKNRKKVSLKIKALDRIGAGRDLLGILSEQNVNITSLKVSPKRSQNVFTMTVNLEVESFNQLTYICTQLEQVEDIIEVQRRFHKKRFGFYALATITILLWVLHPAAIIFYSDESRTHSFIMYGGIVILFFLIYSLKRVTERNFPEFRDAGNKKLWYFTFLIGNFALLTLIIELLYGIHYDITLILGLFLIVYGYFIAEYLHYKKTP